MASRAEVRRPRRWGVGVEPTARDATALGWLADQYAVRADALGLLLGRLSPETPRTVHAWQYAQGSWAELPTLGSRPSAGGKPVSAGSRAAGYWVGMTGSAWVWVSFEGDRNSSRLPKQSSR
jgi:hypothetical protein